MIAQVDMTLEAKNLMRFNQNFKDDPNVIFPRVADHMATKEVLVETFEHGEPLSSFLRHYTEQQGRKELAHTGLRTYLTMLLLHNFIHADLHPGNLLVRHDPETGKNRVVLLDVGLVCELSEYDWLHFKSLFRSIVMGDGRAAAKIMLEHTRQKQISEAEKEAFTEEMNELYTQLRHYKMAELDIGLFLTRVLDVVRTYRVRHDPNFTTLIVGTVILEGIGRQLDPSINILDQSVPYLVWSEKASIQDRMIYLRAMVKDEFESDDSKEVPFFTKLKHILKPLTDSWEVLQSKL
jgi:aarF domain-containing kinase